MRFDSAEFLFFVLAVFLLHRLVAGRKALLVAASYLFYASWNPPFLLLLLASTGVDYAVGRGLERTENASRRRLYLAASLLVNLGLLGWFKYANFVLDNLAHLPLLGGGLLDPLRVEAQIPLGISFYTFQTISYSVDVY